MGGAVLGGQAFAFLPSPVLGISGAAPPIAVFPAVSQVPGVWMVISDDLCCAAHSTHGPDGPF